jgi:transposase
LVNAKVIKLGQDLHAANVVVKVQLDDSVPQPAQKIAIELYPQWLRKLRLRHPDAKFYACYEAGPCGYSLHRTLLEMGISNYVVAPVDMNGKRKNDKNDAAALGAKLDAYVRGNTTAFSTVYVPTPEQEAFRALIRHRYCIARKRAKAAIQGRSALLTFGLHERGAWYSSARWEGLSQRIPEELRKRLERLRKEVLFFQAQLKEVEEEIAQIAVERKVSVPRGVGTLTGLSLAAEVVNWDRFTNRGAISSYTGLCPGEHSSGSKRREGSIDRCGNRQVRRLLVETVWRLVIWQPDYPPLKKLLESTGKRGAKRMVVAIARRLAIDLWRINTGQTTAEKVGLACMSAKIPSKKKAP